MVQKVFSSHKNFTSSAFKAWHPYKIDWASLVVPVKKNYHVFYLSYKIQLHASNNDGVIKGFINPDNDAVTSSQGWL